MEQTMSQARKLTGEARVPGERGPAEQALVLAALSAGESRILNAPPAAARVAELLAGLGVGLERQKGGWRVQGGGLRGFRPAEGVLDLEGLGDAALLLVALLAGQAFSTRFRLGAQAELCRPLMQRLARLGMPVEQETESVFVAGGGRPQGAELEEADLELPLKLALLVGALFAEGTTCWAEPAAHRSRAERFLRERQVRVERHRRDQGFILSVEGGQALAPLEVEIPGDLRLAYPIVGAGLLRKGSDLRLRRVAVRTGERAFLDLLRQIGARIDLEDLGEDVCDLLVRFSPLKSTRVAGQRAAKVLEQVGLLAVLATQAQGEVVIRDIECLRRSSFDYVGHLFASLHALEARVGEFPEGLVVKGGYPLKAARLDCRGDAGLAMAFAVAGLLAEGETTVAGTECLEGVFPGFFETLYSLKERKK